MSVIEPGSVIGILGSGQLGRMFAFSAKRMGYRVHVLSPDGDSPAGQVVDIEIRADYDNLSSIEAFAKSVDVITFEFENIPIKAIEAAEAFAPVRPGGHVLHTTQNRLREKTFLATNGLPVTEFQPLTSEQELEVLQSTEAFRFPAVVKTASWGYDGKGQHKIDSASDLAEAWGRLDRADAVVEEFVDFECELSVVIARNATGEMACYDPILNHHENHILDVSISPSGLPETVIAEATEIAKEVATKLEVVGVLCVELFLRRDGKLLINELAPRPHNSGHLTIDAHVTSQFDQQVLAVCGLPLGSSEQLRPAAMVNVLGDCWKNGIPKWSRCVTNTETKLHLYGKEKPMPGRKMGHITALAQSSSLAAQIAKQARARLIEPQLPSESERTSSKQDAVIAP